MFVDSQPGKWRLMPTGMLSGELQSASDKTVAPIGAVTDELIMAINYL